MVKLRIYFYISLAAAGLHFADNVIRLESYPDLPSTTASAILLYGLVMVSIGVAGYWLCQQAKPRAGVYLLYGYCLMNLVVLAHYTPARMSDSFFDLPVSIHLFIWLEVVAALLLGWHVVAFHQTIRRRNIT